MEANKFSHVGKLCEDDLNPTEKIADILRVKNQSRILSIIDKSKHAAKALNESYLPFRTAKTDKIRAFLVVESKNPIGLGKIVKESEGIQTLKILQTLVDFGQTSTITIKDNFGNFLQNWNVIWAKDISRRQSKEVLGQILSLVDNTKTYEMSVLSVWEKNPLGKMQHVAFDIDDSYQDTKLRLKEALTKWRLVDRYNYRAPSDIKYDELRMDYAKCDEKFQEVGMFDNIKVTIFVKNNTRVKLERV